MRFLYFDTPTQVYAIDPPVLSATQTEKSGELVRLDMTLAGNWMLERGDRIVYKDNAGIVRSMMVTSPAVTHDENGVTTDVVAKDEVWGLDAKLVLDYYATATPADALAKLVKNTTLWTAGTSDASVARKWDYQYESLYDILTDMAATSGLKLSASYALDSTGSNVKTRTLAFKRAANVTVKHRFVLGTDLKSVSHTINDTAVITRMYGRGKVTQQADAGKNIREVRLDFASVNNGLPYVQNDDAVKKYGLTEGVYEDAECEDKNKLLSETRNALNGQLSQSQTWEVSAVKLSSTPDLSVGDRVQVVDTIANLSTEGYISAITQDLLNPSGTTLTIGSQTAGILGSTRKLETVVGQAERLARQQAGALNGLNTSVWDATSATVDANSAGWDRASALTAQLSISDGKLRLTQDGGTYEFDPETGGFTPVTD